MKGPCQCCNRHSDELFVYSSVLGAVSVANCKECMNHCSEPTWLIDFIYEDFGNDFNSMVDDITTFYDNKYISFRDYIKIKEKNNNEKEDKQYTFYG
jgi:hypothetical protein